MRNFALKYSSKSRKNILSSKVVSALIFFEYQNFMIGCLNPQINIHKMVLNSEPCSLLLDFLVLTMLLLWIYKVSISEIWWMFYKSNSQSVMNVHKIFCGTVLEILSYFFSR